MDSKFSKYKKYALDEYSDYILYKNLAKKERDFHNQEMLNKVAD